MLGSPAKRYTCNNKARQLFQIPRFVSPITHGRWTTSGFVLVFRTSNAKAVLYRSDWFQEILFAARRLALFHIVRSAAPRLSAVLFSSSLSREDRGYKEIGKPQNRSIGGREEQRWKQEREATKWRRGGRERVGEGRTSSPTFHEISTSSFDTFYPSLFRLLLIMLPLLLLLFVSRGIPTIVSYRLPRDDYIDG